MNRSPNRAKGFTLLEILIALFIFTIISIMMVTGLHTVLNTQAATEKNAARFDHLQFAMVILSRDLEQTLNRPIRDVNNSQSPAFLGDSHSVTFSHAGLFNPFGDLNRSTLQRTHYFLQGDKLIRETFSALDPTADTPSNQRILFENVAALHFEYLDQKGNFQTTWPPQGQMQNPLPKAVRVHLTLKNWGDLTQLYLIPGGANEN